MNPIRFCLLLSAAVAIGCSAFGCSAEHSGSASSSMGGGPAADGGMMLGCEIDCGLVGKLCVLTEAGYTCASADGGP